MSFWKKINRGMALTLVLVLGVGVYLTVLYASHRADRNEIKKMMDDFIPALGQMYILDDGAAVSGTDAEAQRQAIDAGVRKNLARYMDCEGSVNDELVEQITTWRYNQYSKKLAINDIRCSVDRITDVQFSGNTAIVALQMTIRYDGAIGLVVGVDALDAENAGDETIRTMNCSLSLSCQKQDGKWKIFYCQAPVEMNVQVTWDDDISSGYMILD